MQLSENIPDWLRVWGNFDGVHYMMIAKNGYTLANLPFFPLFPLCIRIIHTATHFPYVVVGQIISISSFTISLFIIKDLLIADSQKKSFFFFFCILFFFPTSFYFTAVYNNSFFLLFTSATLLFGRKRQWFLTSLFAMCASLIRLNGVALNFFILFEYLQSQRQSSKAIQPKTILKSGFFWIVLSIAGFFAHFLYIQIVWGNWHLIFSSMKPWHQDRLILPPQVIFRYINIFVHFQPQHLIFWIALFEFLFFFWYVFLIVWSYKKIRFSYWTFFFVSIGIPLLTGTLQGMPRYGLHLYPFFFSTMIFIKERAPLEKVFYFFISLSLLIVGTILYTHGYFVA